MASYQRWRTCITRITRITRWKRAIVLSALLAGSLFTHYQSTTQVDLNPQIVEPITINKNGNRISSITYSSPVKPFVSSTASPAQSSSPPPPPSLLASTKPQYEHYNFNFTELVRKFELAKVFQSPISPSNQSWCTQGYTKTQPTGLLYNKMPKAASSTMSGISLRIAHRIHSRVFGKKGSCAVKEGHITGLNGARRYFNRDHRTSFLFSTLRDPAKRALSRIFFSRSQQVKAGIKIERGDEVVLELLNSTAIQHQFGLTDRKRGGFQLAYTIMNVSEEVSVYDSSHPTDILNPNLAASLVRQILVDYDFMVIVERFDECIVLMQLLLGLDTSDIMYLSAKKGGKYYEKNGKCVKIMKSFISPTVARFTSSKEWHAINYGDYLLIEAVSQSIDLTIEAIGQERFDEAFEAFQNWQKRAQDECSDKAIFPCSSKGQVQKESKSNCYNKDWGCGFPCLDNMKPK